MAQTFLHGEFQEYASSWPLFKNRPDFYLQNMSDKIPCKVIFSNQDELCPPADQLHTWNKIPNR